MNVKEHLRRSLLPRAVIATGEIDWPQRLAARLRRGLGGRGRIELYFAFDDPYSAIALPALQALAVNRDLVLDLYPIIERGIDEDPAAEQRRRHAVTDSCWLARRNGLEFTRTLPLESGDVAFLAAWTESVRGSVVMTPFACSALEQLWFGSSGPVRQVDFLPLFRDCFQKDPTQALTDWMPRLQGNRNSMLCKGHWESPAARVAGQWFFAHERITQIDARLTALGW